MASKRRTYDDEFRASAVLLLEAQGYPHTKGALTAAARQIGVPARTLSRWFNKEQNPPPDHLVNEKRGELSERLDTLIDLLVDEMIKSVRHGAPLNHLATTFGIAVDKQQNLAARLAEVSSSASSLMSLPADSLAAPFLAVYRDIKEHRHTEYLLYGGRGSTKSSFVSLVLVWLVVTTPELHALAVRHVANTLRDSVYSQIGWAIDTLGLTEKFSRTKSPLEITYLPTGQKIYFRGADDPLKIKSIKPPFGHIGALWFEELDQFAGPEAVRSIEQSAIRAADVAVIFKTYNPPRTRANWANEYATVPKATQYQHKSTYLEVPPEWLGKVFLDEALHLKDVNPVAYEHEYLGEVVGTGGDVFENLELRAISDAEIAQFDRLHHGLDWGWYPDPLAWNKMHYDAARMTLYVFDELHVHKTSNEEAARTLREEKGLAADTVIICDSAEPKSVADFRAFGLYARAAEKGPDSVTYSMKWLQRLAQIVIDPVRCPHTAREFERYEYEQDKDGNYISAYPDRDNHHIDAVRYGMNLVWRRKGQ